MTSTQLTEVSPRLERLALKHARTLVPAGEEGNRFFSDAARTIVQVTIVYLAENGELITPLNLLRVLQAQPSLIAGYLDLFDHRTRASVLATAKQALKNA